MDRLSYLNPHTMKAQCDSAIEILEEQVEQLRKVTAAIDEFVAADEIKSSKFDALKQHMADYKTLIQAIYSVNEEDIMDWKTLKEAVGDEILDGDVILEQKERAAYMEETNRSLGEYYDELRRDPNLFPEEVIEYEIRATEYYKLAESLRVIKEEWERKEEAYDHIQENTGGLFPNAGLRRTIQNGNAPFKSSIPFWIVLRNPCLLDTSRCV